MNKNKETEKIKVAVVALGSYQAAAGKATRGHRYIELEDFRRVVKEESEKQTRPPGGRDLHDLNYELYAASHHYDRPLGSSKRGADIVGGVFEGYWDKEGTTYRCGSWLYQGKVTGDEFKFALPVDDLVLSLVAADRLEQIRLEAARRTARDKRTNEVFEALEPVRVAYEGCRNRRARAIFVNELVDYLNRRA